MVGLTQEARTDGQPVGIPQVVLHQPKGAQIVGDFLDIVRVSDGQTCFLVELDLDRGTRTIDQAGQGDAYPGVVGLLANLCRLDCIRSKHHPVLGVYPADIPEDSFEVRQLGRAKTQKIGVTRRAMWNVEPQIEQQRSFQQELTGVGGDAEPVQQALEGITGQGEIEVLPGFTSTVEQAGPHGSCQVSSAHHRLSMYGRITFATRQSVA